MAIARALRLGRRASTAPDHHDLAALANGEFVAVEGARYVDTPSNPQFIKDVRDSLARHSKSVST